jgi:enoyl-CoA hydratase/carnithine racemase
MTSFPNQPNPGPMKAHGLTFQIQEDIAIVRLTRATKRNAINDDLIATLGTAFGDMPDTVRAVVLDGDGPDFCAGLDLSDLEERSAAEGVHHSRRWHAALNLIQFGKVPVVAALHGAVIGGGLELASSCHIRIADTSTFYALPEGARGIFVGGGGSVRIPKLIGVARMTDMMLTGRTYNASEGEVAGFAQYLVPEGSAFEKAMEIARRLATNAFMTNYALIQALPRIAEQSTDHGLFTESLMSAIAQDAPVAKERVRAFLAGRAAKVQRA